MKTCLRLFTTLCVVALLSLHVTLAQSNSRALALVRASINAMGGEAQLRSLKSIKLEGIGHVNYLEQSERPEGPYLVSYEQTSELMEFAGVRLRQSVETKDGQTADWNGRTLIVSDNVAAFLNGTRLVPASVVQLKDAELRSSLGPERLLLTALEASDLRLAGETTLQDVPHRIIKFSWQGIPVTIYLNAATSLPTAVETLRAHPYEHFWTVWGDVTTRVYYSYWTLEAGGLRYPRQWDTVRNGLPYRTFTVTTLALNPQLPADSFSIPEEVRSLFKQRAPVTIDELPLGRADRPASEIVPGVIQIPGRWNATLVRQRDGVVILEAPISSGYSAKVLAEAARRFPNLPVKAVISTADSWPHIGGVREYVARAIPVYALDVNRPLLERMLTAPHTILPDALARNPRRARFEVVSKKTVIGSGENALELYPIRSETGERMMMVYFPSSRLLYGSDLVQKMRDGSFFMPQYLSELMEAAARERLTVERVFAMHTEPTPWSEVQAAVNKASAPAAPK